MGFLYVYAIASVFDNQSYISQANNLIVEILSDTTNKHLLKKIFNRFFKQDLLQRTLDKAIRIVNVLDYIDICKINKFDVDDTNFLKWLSKLWDDVFWCDSLKKEKSNWGIIETASLLYSATYLNKDKYVKELKDRLLRQLKIQIKEDGSHTESAPMYLVQIELSLLKYLKENDCTEIEFYARKIADYLLEITDPLGNILNIGDTDVSNMSDVFIIASKILNDHKYYQKVTRKPLL